MKCAMEEVQNGESIGGTASREDVDVVEEDTKQGNEGLTYSLTTTAPSKSLVLRFLVRLRPNLHLTAHLSKSPSLRLRSATMFFDCLPVDLIAEILGELDLESLIKMAYVSKRFYLVASDPSLNPWRRPIMRNLRLHIYDSSLKHLSVRLIVPRRNWIEIITLARPSFILYEATLPNLKSEEWEECFKRRFLPSWRKWRKESSWKEAFLK